MYYFEVVTEEMKNAAQRIENRAEEFDLEWEKIYADLKVLSTDAWTGYASEEFSSSLQQYKAEFKKVSTEMREYAKALRGGGDNYEDVEITVKKNVPKIL